MHEMKLKDIYFEKIVSGEKIYEIRLNDVKRKLIKIGDLICFKKISNEANQILTEVEDLIYFDSFSDMSKILPAKLIGMEGYLEKQIIDTYHEFYSIEDEQNFGVVAIKIKIKE